MYLRPPREGLPGVPADALIEILKGVFGLKEAPRQWYISFSRILVECGFEELKTAKGCFVLRSDEPDPETGVGQVQGLLVAHVDDGCTAGFGDKYEQAMVMLREKLDVRKEAEFEFKFLGRWIRQDEHV